MKFPVLRERKAVFQIVIELILIIVGVLAALGVENWRAANAEKRTGQEYLVSLRDAVQRDTTMIKAEIKKAFDKRSAATKMLQLVKESKAVSPTEFADIIDNIMIIINPSYTTAVYEELRYTGNLKLISNKDLKSSIITYYSDLAIINNQVQSTIGYNDDFLDVLDFDELTYKNEFSQGVILDRIRKNEKAYHYILKLQRDMYFYQQGMIYTTLPKSLELLDKINAELGK